MNYNHVVCSQVGRYWRPVIRDMSRVCTPVPLRWGERGQRMTTLLATDRCDRCGAQAVHRFLFAGGELLFCAHHERQHRDRLPQNVAASSGVAGE